jgi:hypothetical protein
MCDCIGVEMGSFTNTVLMGYYPVMRQYRDNRVAAGLSGDGIPIDRCLVDEVVSLWKADIRTYGNCCGHNITGCRPFINIDEDDMPKALALGYEIYTFPNDPNRRDTIVPKSVQTVWPKGFREHIQALKEWRRIWADRP